jgi:hypothetical protein
MTDILNKLKLQYEYLNEQSLQISTNEGRSLINNVATGHEWATSALSLIGATFSRDSIHFQNFQKIYIESERRGDKFEAMKGVFNSAKKDFEKELNFNFQRSISGEILGDFVAMARASLGEGHKDVAAVLASAALEDALKRFAVLNNLNIDDKNMTEVINALKTQGLVSGPQKSILESMPKLRNAALHAEWDKLRPEDVSALIGFVEQFLIQKFSS